MNQSHARAIGGTIAAMYFLYCASTPREWHFIDFVNLIFHEAGHTLFIFFGEFIHVLMGSGFQVLLPLLIAACFWFTQQRFSSGIVLMWAGQSLINVSVYADDAIDMQLSLLGGDSSGHDWNYLLSVTDTLRYTHQIAGFIAASGFACILLGILISVRWLKD
jgi:hypothetical protein